MERTPCAARYRRPTARRRQRFQLFSLTAIVLLAAAGLATVGGPPRWPGGLPQPDQFRQLLSGSTLPFEPFAWLLLDAAWLMCLWIVGSLGLELLVVAAEAAAQGAAWVQALRRVADRLTVPLVRRTVAAAFAVQVLTRSVSIAAAAPLPPAEVTLVGQPTSPGVNLPGRTYHQAVAAPTYLVQPGDTLWSIAQQAYGSGSAYRRVIEANLGRRMPEGQVFNARGVIQPGWDLVVPAAAADIEEVDGQRWYSVQRGDTLSAIAAIVLGDESRWRELFELNRDAAIDGGAHILADPDLIWPGLRLQLPPAQLEATELQPTEPRPPAPSVATATEEIDLHAASVPFAVYDVVPVDRAGELPLSALPPAELEQTLPLLRTPHALEPVVLAPADAASVGQDPSSPAEADEGSVPVGPAAGEWPVAGLALGGVGLAALVGAAALGARRRRRLRRLPHERETDVVVAGGFAEAELTHEFAPGLRGAAFDPVVALVSRLQEFLEDYNLSDIRLVTVTHGRSATTLTLAASLAEQGLLIDLAPEFAASLEAAAEAWVSADQDVVLRLERLRKTRLLPAASGQFRQAPCLLPLGLRYDRQTLSAVWDSLGHMLVASLAGHGAETILTSLVAALTARHSPAQLRLWLIARPRALSAALLNLPHIASVFDADDERAVAEAAERLRTELEQRTTRAAADELVIVLPELISLGEHAASFELLAAGATKLGVRFVAATGVPREALNSSLLSIFGTRMVLRMEDEETSVGLLGVADAAFLAGGGRLLLRLEGREAVELYGYQVAPEHLERLVRVMRSAYSVSTDAQLQRGARAPERAPLNGHDAAAPSSGAADIRAPVAERAPEPVDHEVRQPAAEAAAEPAAHELAEVVAGAPPSADAQAVPPVAATTSTSTSTSTRTSTSPGPPAPTDAPASVTAPTEVAAPPLQIVCLGGPRVLCAGQQVWPRLASGESKPWEFLLYLACQPAEGVSTADAVEALWPEDDPQDAAHRFRQLRYRLRNALATVTGAPATDGICLEHGTLRLDPAVVHSDAAEFLDVVRRARLSPAAEAMGYLERARALYMGDLLEGAHARRYCWVDERDASGVTLREHFRRQFQLASTRLAELYASAGEPEQAIELYRELAEIDPGDERLWRALFRLHAHRADRPALVREEHRLRAALRELSAELDDAGGERLDEPSRETVAEYQRLLASVHQAEREPVRA